MKQVLKTSYNYQGLDNPERKGKRQNLWISTCITLLIMLNSCTSVDSKKNSILKRTTKITYYECVHDTVLIWISHDEVKSECGTVSFLDKDKKLIEIIGGTVILEEQ